MPGITSIQHLKGINDGGLDLEGLIACNSIGLSEQNIALLQKEGDYGKFDSQTIAKLFSETPSCAENVQDLRLVNKKLTLIHIRIIGHGVEWINLKKLNLSKKLI